jgi:hypothetical protein
VADSESRPPLVVVDVPRHLAGLTHPAILPEHTDTAPRTTAM